MIWRLLSLRGNVAPPVLPRHACLLFILFHRGRHLHWWYLSSSSSSNSSSMAQQQPKNCLSLSPCRCRPLRRLRYPTPVATTSKMAYRWTTTSPRCQLKCPRSMRVPRHHPRHSAKRALPSMMPVDLRILEMHPSLHLRCLLIHCLEQSLLQLL